jgi:glycosyltransferase involved in cell wall biosynthesis
VPLSVIMFCPQFRPVIGGAERQTEKLAIALVAAGCQVTIVTPRIDVASPEREEHAGVSVVRFPLIDLSRHCQLPGVALLNIPYILWQIARTLHPLLNGASALHCHVGSLQTAGAMLAARRRGIPTLCKAAIAGNRSDLGEVERNGASGHLISWLLRRTTDTWIAITVAVEESLVQAGINIGHIEQIPNGVVISSPVGSRQVGETAKRFLYLGRLATNIDRDIPTLIRAFERLHTNQQSCELAIVGGGDLLDETRGFASQSTARCAIHLPGFDEPEKWLEWCDCFVLPSRREGLSNALLEAMSARRACIANDIPPNREVLAGGDAGVLVSVGDAERLFQEMLRMATTPGFCAAMGERALIRAETCYSIDAVAKRYIQLYQRIVKRASERRL